MADLIEYWKRQGYTEEQVFVDEYTLLVNPRTIDSVRIYLNGDVWKTDPETGVYHRVKNKDESVTKENS